MTEKRRKGEEEMKNKEKVNETENQSGQRKELVKMKKEERRGEKKEKEEESWKIERGIEKQIKIMKEILNG